MHKTLIYNAEVVRPDADAPLRGFVSVVDGLIDAVGAGNPPAGLIDEADELVDARGMTLMPGAVDMHVHYREPGLTHKATIASESAAAAAGGVTSWIDMPNCIPPTTSREAWEDKMRRAAETAAGNYAFFVGADGANLDLLRRLDYTRVPGVKLFMGQSTGKMAVSGADAVAAVFAEVDAPIVVHAEDDATVARNLESLSRECAPERMPIAWHALLRDEEACIRATERAMELASRYGSRLHVAHLTTAEEAAMFDAVPGRPWTVSGDVRRVTCEVSPHHLWWSSEDYGTLGARIKMNPSVKAPRHREALRRALLEGRIDAVATDHAPHLLAEKGLTPQANTPNTLGLLKAVSGAPAVQYSLPMMLSIYNDPSFVAYRTATAPAALLGIRGRGRIAPGYAADLALVERADWTVTDDDARSLCGWTPLAGQTLGWRVARVWINGAAPGERSEALSFER